MSSTCVIPLLLSVYVGLLVGLVAWGYLRVRRSEFGDVLTWRGDGVLMGLLLLAAFMTGAFLAYVVLDIEF